jgi:CheY-like chemotaxis protein
MPDRKILVADDEPSIRTLITRFLVRQDFEVDPVNDGAEAIERLDHHSYDALVLDLMMPRVDGFGVLKHIHETNPDMASRTVVVTAFPKTAATELHEPCRVLSKPFDLNDLLDAIEECLTH